LNSSASSTTRHDPNVGGSDGYNEGLGSAIIVEPSDVVDQS
jgi:hypothetical protein